MSIEDIVARLERGESVPVSEVEELTGPMPGTRGECLAELMRNTGLSAAELEAISGRDLTSDPDKQVP